MTEKTVENCCTSNCACMKSCGSGKSFRSSLGRIIVGVMLLGATFLFGLKSGMMMDGAMMRGGGNREKNGGCMMGKKHDGGCMMDKGGCMMDKAGMMKKDGVAPQQEMMMGTGDVPSSGAQGTGN